MKRNKKNQFKRAKGWFWQQAKDVAFGFGVTMVSGYALFLAFDYGIQRGMGL